MGDAEWERYAARIEQCAAIWERDAVRYRGRRRDWRLKRAAHLRHLTRVVLG